MANPRGTVTADVEARLRADARALVEAAIAAAAPDDLVRAALGEEPAEAAGRVLVLAVGKAAVPMARGAVAALGGRIGGGLVLAPSGAGGRAPEGLEVHRGGHPLPDQEGVEGARAALELVRRAGPDDLILLLLSGGGSALLALPAGEVTLDDLRRVTDRLLRSGADIRELNTVRKHLEVLKGGGLAREAVPTPVRALVLSDVVGDALDVVSSGPVTADASSWADAIEVLEAHGLWEEAPPSVRTHLLYGREGELPATPREGDPCFEGVRAEVVGNAGVAVEAAARAAEERGYRAEVLSLEVTGEAREVGRDLARAALEAGAPTALLQAGETTVTVRGAGSGGRNQEVALGAAVELDGQAGVLDGQAGVLVFSVGTDGVDGPTDAAGALASGRTAERVRALGLDAVEHLERNDSHACFEALGDLLVTGPTGTNVMDVMGALVLPGEQRGG